MAQAKSRLAKILLYLFIFLGFKKDVYASLRRQHTRFYRFNDLFRLSGGLGARDT